MAVDHAGDAGAPPTFRGIRVVGADPLGLEFARAELLVEGTP
ncbi:hypothetical protein [Kitasatospora cheerisanensis]|nr:hypothetical protein [Kitasatospora cheerisanensis]